MDLSGSIRFGETSISDNHALDLLLRLIQNSAVTGVRPNEDLYPEPGAEEDQGAAPEAKGNTRFKVASHPPYTPCWFEACSCVDRGFFTATIFFDAGRWI